MFHLFNFFFVNFWSKKKVKNTGKYGYSEINSRIRISPSKTGGARICRILQDIHLVEISHQAQLFFV